MRAFGRLMSRGLISLPTKPLCFPEWELIGNVLTYGLYRRLGQEHITPIGRTPTAEVCFAHFPVKRLPRR